MAENLIQTIASLRLVPAAARTWEAGDRNDLCGLTHLAEARLCYSGIVPQYGCVQYVWRHPRSVLGLKL